MSNKKEANQLGCQFEQDNGGIEFLKVCMSAFSRLIVDKGVASEEELRQYFIDEVKRRENEE